MEIPVYIVTGFLCGGKTTFINKFIATDIFTNKRVLVINCESGEESVSTEITFDRTILVCEIINRADLTPQKLESSRAYASADAVIIECNGMWSIVDLYRALPEDWSIEGKYCCEEGPMLEYYAESMDSLLAEHARSCKSIFINRCNKHHNINDMYHILRNYTQTATIQFEFDNGKKTCFQTENFQFMADSNGVVHIAMTDFPIFLETVQKNPKKYEGMVIEGIGELINIPNLYTGYLFGCWVLTYSVKNMDFMCLKSDFENVEIDETVHWINLTATLNVHDMEPTLTAITYNTVQAPYPQFVVFA